MMLPGFVPTLRSLLVSCSLLQGRLRLQKCPRNVAKRFYSCETSSSQPASPANLRILDIGGPPVCYREAWRWQHAIADELRRDENAPDTLLLLEHTPVYTLGTRSTVDNVLFNGTELPCDEEAEGRLPGIDDAPLLVRTERGGEVTYHGPGQLVAYPILNLNRHRRDLHWYMRQLEESVVEMLAQEYGVLAGRKDGLTGVWVGDGKLAAIGLKVSKWVTMHGVAINGDMALGPFERIVPCGIDDRGLYVTNVARVASDEADSSVRSICNAYVRAFCKVFGPYRRRSVEGADARLLAEELALRKESPRLHKR